MRAIVLNGTLKPSPAESSTEALAAFLLDALAEEGVEGRQIRLVDHHVAPGVETEAQSPDDGWPAIHAELLDADIVVLAAPTWLGQPSSVIKGALERMDAMLSETDEAGVPVAYNKVAGFVVVGNEDGAHAVIANLAQAVIDIGFTVPGQAWTYWNKGPGPGETVYLTASDEERAWTHETGRAAAHNLVHAARALAAMPIPKPPNG
jgi:multimeric flavodoxin WrbA